MSGVVKAVKKIFKKIVKSPIFKAIAIAAIVWFTAGTAMAYFGAGSATAGSLGASMASSASTMWTTTTAFFGAEAGAGVTSLGAEAGAASGLAGGTGLGANAALDLTIAGNTANAASISSGLLAGESSATLALSSVGASTSGAVGASSFGAADLTIAGNTSSVMGAGAGAAAPVAAPIAESGLGYTAPSTLTGTMGQPAAMDLTLLGNAAPGTTGAGVGGAKTGMMGWLADNPMATMMLGQGVMGAASSYEADKEATRQEALITARDAAEQKRLDERGLMGYDQYGNYGGVVETEMANAPTVAQTVAEPGAAPGATQAPVTQQVSPQQVAAPIAPVPPVPTAQQVAVPREQLPQMNQQGLIAGA